VTSRTWRRLRRRWRRASPSERLVASAVVAGAVAAAAIHGNIAPPAPSPAAAGAGAAVAGGTNEALANAMAAAAPYRWTGGQATCLDELWNRESGFDAAAVNGQSGATGIPQLNPNYYAVPADWTAPATQIRWGLSYVAATYETPCAAWNHEEADGWY
jgi:hypothetical protein